MSKPEFIYVIYIEAPCEKVWDALIDREMNKRILVPASQRLGLESRLALAARGL